mmetsp:Transcript_11503/g.23400  ORF Transcript_11503/g.23400 Transcript_11503/m.23400 type:complete len:85 (-) Transcript_11503:383-637(-)
MTIKVSTGTVHLLFACPGNRMLCNSAVFNAVVRIGWLEQSGFMLEQGDIFLWPWYAPDWFPVSEAFSVERLGPDHGLRLLAPTA